MGNFYMLSRVSKYRIWILFMILFLLCDLVSPVWAVTNYTVETIPNTRLSDRFNHVSNPDGILSSNDVVNINKLLNNLEDSLGIEVAVVAVNNIGDYDARMFATDLFKHWGIGKKGIDNGLLIQLVTEPTQRSIVFETGYGIEGTLPDIVCQQLQQRYMIPMMKRGDYSGGMLNGVAALYQYLMASDYDRSALIGEKPNDKSDAWPLSITAIMFMVILGLPVLFTYLKRRPQKCPQCGNKTLIYTREQIVQEATRYSEGAVDEIYVCKNCGHTERRRKIIDRIHPNNGGTIFMGGGGSWGGGSSGGSWGGGSSGGGGSISRF